MRNFFTLNCSGSDLPYRMSDRILDIAGIVLVILQLLLFIGLYEWDKEQQCDGGEVLHTPCGWCLPSCFG